MNEPRLIVIDNTKFIFKTNFAGDPNEDRFGSTKRRGNIIIPDPEMAQDLFNRGFKVKATKPRPGEEEDFEPTYYISVMLNYDSPWPPEVYLVSGSAAPVPLDENSVGVVDKCYVLRVRVALNPYENPKTGIKSMYIRTMYVEQDVADDPFAHMYANNGNGEGTLPF
jgi:hypothetical protein